MKLLHDSLIPPEWKKLKIVDEIDHAKIRNPRRKKCGGKRFTALHICDKKSWDGPLNIGVQEIKTIWKDCFILLAIFSTFCLHELSHRQYS